MKTFGQFISEGPSYDSARKIAPGINPEILKRRLAKNAARNQQSQPGNRSGQKLLPGGSTALARTKKTNTGGTQREPIGKSVFDKKARTRPTAGYMTNPEGPSGPKSGVRGNPIKDSNNKLKNNREVNSTNEVVKELRRQREQDEKRRKEKERWDLAKNIAKKIGSAALSSAKKSRGQAQDVGGGDLGTGKGSGRDVG